MPLYPACFPTLSDYESWRAMAIKAKEQATPCDDCSQAYKLSAGASCKQQETQQQFVIHLYVGRKLQEI